MLTSRKISESQKSLRGFREYRWRSSTIPSNNRVETFWVIRTNLRKEKFLMYMKMKLLIEGLPEDELQLLVDAPGVLNDNLFLAALRAKRSGVSLEVLEQRLERLFNLGLSLLIFNINLYYTLKGTARFSMFLAEKPIGKTKRFSGYVRNSSAVGSKRQSRSNVVPEHFQWSFNVEYDYYSFLSVGELTSGAPGDNNLILKSSNRTKRSSTKISRK